MCQEWIARGIPVKELRLGAFIVVALLLCNGCIKPSISLFSEAAEPLREFTLQGSGTRKILIIPIKGFISDSHEGLLFNRRPGMVQEVVSQLKKAQEDKDIRAVILKIDSPGGSVTASDILYHEITGFKERSGVKLVAVMMGVAASGGYYIALPSDYILAHPTTITGSVGVVSLRPNLAGFMDKIGLQIDVDKSGRNKDMGSPFRKATGEEQEIMQNLIDELAGRFLNLVVAHRKINDEAKTDISSARIYTAGEAVKLGLVDRIGYLDDAVRKASEMSGLPENAKLVVYRRTKYADDNLYNASSMKSEKLEINLIDMGFADVIPTLHSGFYYLWLPGRPGG
jgi:protease IV